MLITIEIYIKVGLQTLYSVLYVHVISQLILT